MVCDDKVIILPVAPSPEITTHLQVSQNWQQDSL